MNKYLEKIALNKYENHLTYSSDNPGRSLGVKNDAGTLGTAKIMDRLSTKARLPESRKMFKETSNSMIHDFRANKAKDFFGDSLGLSRVGRGVLQGEVSKAKLVLGKKAPSSKIMEFARKVAAGRKLYS
jgi:hypothetical protein